MNKCPRLVLLTVTLLCDLVVLGPTQSLSAQGANACKEESPGKVPRDATENKSCGRALPAPQSHNLTLSRARDYRFVAGNVDCPNCKNLFCATFQPPLPNTRFVNTDYVAMRSQGHWCRCQVQSKCGRAEFSDPADPKQDCAGKQSCNVCRATDDATEAEDDITFTYQ